MRLGKTVERQGFDWFELSLGKIRKIPDEPQSGRAGGLIIIRLSSLPHYLTPYTIIWPSHHVRSSLFHA